MPFAVLILIVGVLVIVPSDPNGKWASKTFIKYSNGSYARLFVNENTFMIGEDIPDEGMVKKSENVRQFDFFSKDGFAFSVKIYGPVMLVLDKESNFCGWCWKVGGKKEAGERIRGLRESAEPEGPAMNGGYEPGTSVTN